MAKKRAKVEKSAKPFLGSLDRLGGKKLVQHGAEESARGKEARKRRVGSQ